MPPKGAVTAQDRGPFPQALFVHGVVFLSAIPGSVLQKEESGILTSQGQSVHGFILQDDLAEFKLACHRFARSKKGPAGFYAAPDQAAMLSQPKTRSAGPRY